MPYSAEEGKFTPLCMRTGMEEERNEQSSHESQKVLKEITEYLRLEGAFGDRLVQPHFLNQGQLQ